MADKCPSAEKDELPRRLIDWFHVLKTNEREKKYKDEGIEREPILKEMKFNEAKLKAMCKFVNYYIYPYLLISV